MTFPRSSSLPVLFVVLLAAACGGGSKEPSSPSSSWDEEPRASASSADVDGAGAESEAEPAEAFSGFSCGQGSCPMGAYCDESKANLAACAWISDCGAEPSCGCLTRILGASCSCEFEGGGPRVRCSD
ncbi:MAG: hypothetical protein B6A08_13515 [Sorangiineae bacterium NIC37A_2]|nr:MAG: hypothetical protein B6A08_13515 [Sorangiineae bacterium NIC37A_2]